MTLTHCFDISLFVACSAVEQFIRKYPGHVDLRKDDGYTALHLASLNDHLDVVTTLADLVSNTHFDL